jgi:hypothetical protein
LPALPAGLGGGRRARLAMACSRRSPSQRTDLKRRFRGVQDARRHGPVLSIDLQVWEAGSSGASDSFGMDRGLPI